MGRDNDGRTFYCIECEARARVLERCGMLMIEAADALEDAYGHMHSGSRIGDLIADLRHLADDGE
jgi:hypothetical protein